MKDQISLGLLSVSQESIDKINRVNLEFGFFSYAEAFEMAINALHFCLTNEGIATLIGKNGNVISVKRVEDFRQKEQSHDPETI